MLEIANYANPNINNNHTEKQVLAAIDIGTNSIHMVVVEIEPSLPAFTIIAKEKDMVRLGDRDPKSGNLTPEAISRALATLKRCKDLAESFQASEIVAVATSATREAPNGKDFLQLVESELGIVVNLISGQEEARRIYLGVLSGMDLSDRPYAIIDIGGGSTEVILADIQEPRVLSSTKVGAVRLTQKFINNDPINDEEFNYLRAYIRGMLERPIEEIRSKLERNETLLAIGTSGTIETIAEVHANDELGYVPDPLNGYEFSRNALEKIVKKLAKMSCKERLEVSGITEKRAEIIVPGAIILLEAMTMLELDKIMVCERALREGIIVDWMLSRGLIDSRLRYQDEVRKRNVWKIAHKYQVDLAYARKVAEFALSIFDQTKGQLHDWGKNEREFLWSAAILHNCGIYISHSSHHKHSYYLIRNAELLGFTELELELIANIARYHRRSKPKKKHETYQKLNDRERLLVRQLSAILRIATALDRRQKSAIDNIICEYEADSQSLHLKLLPAKIGDDCAFELWSLDYKKDVFEEEYGVRLIPTIIQDRAKISQ